MREGWVGRMRCRRLDIWWSLAPVRKFTRSLLPRVHHRRPLYFVDLTNLPFMFLTPYRPNKQLITHCDRKPSVLTACLLLVRNDGRVGRWRRFGHQSIIDHSLSDRNPYCCFGMVGGEHSDRGRKLVRRHWVMSELGRCPYLLLPDVALVRMG